MFRIAINKLFEWIFSRVLASHIGNPHLIPGRDIVSPGTSSLGWSSLSINLKNLVSKLYEFAIHETYKQTAHPPLIHTHKIQRLASGFSYYPSLF